jgi:hypothetical protein
MPFSKKQVATPSEGSYAAISLTQGQYAIVDRSDYEFLMQFKWFADWHEDMGNFYARIGRRGDRRTSMHRFILGLKKGDGKIVDHINHNTLDNRLSNLRIVTTSENGLNRKGPMSNNRSGFVGVSWDEPRGKWKAYVGVAGVKEYLGLFHTPEEAYSARVSFLKEIKS